MNDISQIFWRNTEWQHTWQMEVNERFLVIGICAALMPRRTLEIGVARGVHTKWLAQFSTQVTSVDIVREMKDLPENVEFLQMKSGDFFLENKEIFDYVVVDADHSEIAAYLDLKEALKIGKYICMHDTKNFECRRGYERALQEAAALVAYADLDLLPGAPYLGVTWGGVGLAMTK